MSELSVEGLEGWRVLYLDRHLRHQHVIVFDELVRSTALAETLSQAVDHAGLVGTLTQSGVHHRNPGRRMLQADGDDFLGVGAVPAVFDDRQENRQIEVAQTHIFSHGRHGHTEGFDGGEVRDFVKDLEHQIRRSVRGFYCMDSHTLLGVLVESRFLREQGLIEHAAQNGQHCLVLEVQTVGLCNGLGKPSSIDSTCKSKVGLQFAVLTIQPHETQNGSALDKVVLRTILDRVFNLI